MRLLHILLLPLCLLFAQVGPGAGLLRRLGHRDPKCARIGGVCRYSNCPEGTRENGTCYKRKAKCCV